MASPFKIRLRKASFKGVSFEVTGGSVTIGRRTQVHEYPQRDTPYTEDLGKATRTYTVNGFVIGDDFIGHSKRLIETFESGGAGILVHPWLGRVKVVATSQPQITWSLEKRYASFSVTFTEAGELTNPFIKDIGSELRKLADGLVSDALDALGITMDDIGNAQDFVDSIMDGSFANVLGCLEGCQLFAVFGLADSVANLASDLAASVTESHEAAGSAVINAIGLDSAVDAVHDWKQAGHDIAELLGNSAMTADSEKVYAAELASESGEGASVQASTSEQAGAALEGMTRAVLLSDLAGSVSYMGTSSDSGQEMSFEELSELRDDTLDAIENEMIIQGTDRGDLYQTLSDLYDATWQRFEQDLLKENSVITAVPSEPEPALVLAYDQWGDASRDDEIITRNRVPNPLFTGGVVRMTEN